MTALVVDGISASGKSLFLRGVRRFLSDSHPSFTALHLSEHLTERFFERSRPQLADVHAHVARILRIVSETMAVHAQSPFAGDGRIVTATVERLFATLLSRDLMTVAFFTEHSDLLACMGLRCILLTVPRHMIEERVAFSLNMRNRAWKDHVSRLGGTAAAAALLAAQQDRMRLANETLSRHFSTEVVEVADPAMLEDASLIRRVLNAGSSSIP